MRLAGPVVIWAGAALAAYAAPAAARSRSGRTLFPATTRVASRDAVALTFDDGPDRLTCRFLDLLDDAGARATFFVVGEQAAAWPGMVGEISTRGHEVAVHCFRHRSHLLLPPRRTLEDMRRARAVVEEATEVPVRLFRPPYGVFNAASWAEADRQGWRRVLWSRCGREWEVGSSVASVLVGLGRPEAGDVVLLHDSSRYGPGDAARLSLGALPEILEGLSRSGLRARPAGELLGPGRW